MYALFTGRSEDPGCSLTEAGGPGNTRNPCTACVPFPMWTCWRRVRNRCVYFSLSLLECNRMQVHKGPPEEERLLACSRLLVRRLEKKSSGKCGGQSRSGTVEEGLCVCPRPVPKDPQLVLSMQKSPVSFSHAYPNPLGTGKGHWIVRTVPSPRLAPF